MLLLTDFMINYLIAFLIRKEDVIDCICLADGLEQRMNHTIPKQFFPLHGKPIIAYSLETMEKVSEINRIIVMYNKDFCSVWNGFKNC